MYFNIRTNLDLPPIIFKITVIDFFFSFAEFNISTGIEWPWLKLEQFTIIFSEGSCYNRSTQITQPTNPQTKNG